MSYKSSDFKKDRILLGLTQSALSKKLGVNIATVWRWEKGNSPIGTIVKLAMGKLKNDKIR
jgi:transcriptional regulator with XRE-family HTH domain